jgi:hypothetical protein
MARNFYIQDTAIAPSVVFENFHPEGYLLIGVDSPLIDNLIQKKYDEYALAGTKYFKDTRVMFVKMRMLSQITADYIIEIEGALKDVKSNLVSGDWKTAELILINHITKGAVVSNELYDKLLFDFQKYILDNY